MCLGLSSAGTWLWLIQASRGPSSEGSVCSADEPEAGLGCTVVPGRNSSRNSSNGWCLVSVGCMGERDLPSGLARGLGAVPAWQDGAHEICLQDAFKCSAGYCLVGTAHSYLQTCRGLGCFSQSCSYRVSDTSLFVLLAAVNPILSPLTSPSQCC